MSSTTPAPEPASENPDQIPVDNLLGLKILVVFMGVLLLVCVVAFFAVLLVSNSGEKASDPVEIPQMVLDVAADEKITNMTLGNRELAVQVEGPNGRRILIVNPYTADHKAVIFIGETGPDIP